MYGGGFDAGGMDYGGGGGFDQGGQGQFGGFNGGIGGGGVADSFGGNQFQGSQGGGGFAVDNSTPDGKAKSKGNQSLIPVTIKQLKNAPTGSNGDTSFTIDGQELNQVTICGVIMSAEEQNTNLQYMIDDGSDAGILVKMWIDADADEAMVERRAQWKEGKLVRVVGQLRIFNHVRSVVAFNIQPITDYNEYTFHFIEVVHTHLKHTKGQPPVGGMAGAAGTSYTGMAGNVQQNAGGYAQPQQAGRQVSLQDTVLQYFQSNNESESGETVESCWEAMKAAGSVQQIRDAVECLVAEGHLYSTIDDDHFKST